MQAKNVQRLDDNGGPMRNSTAITRAPEDHELEQLADELQLEMRRFDEMVLAMHRNCTSEPPVLDSYQAGGFPLEYYFDNPSEYFRADDSIAIAKKLLSELRKTNGFLREPFHPPRARGRQ